MENEYKDVAIMSYYINNFMIFSHTKEEANEAIKYLKQ